MACRREICACMRRFLAALIAWVGLIGAAVPAFACASADAAGDCCPPDAPPGCAQVYAQLGVELSVCVTGTASAQMVVAKDGRELQGGDRGSADPLVPTAPPVSSLDTLRANRLAVALSAARCTDASLTYLHTGRLRL